MPRRRVQLDFSESGFDALQSIKAMSDAQTNAEVVRNALRVYGWFLEQRKSGTQVIESDGTTLGLIF